MGLLRDAKNNLPKKGDAKNINQAKIGREKRKQSRSSKAQLLRRLSVKSKEQCLLWIYLIIQVSDIIMLKDTLFAFSFMQTAFKVRVCFSF